MLQEGSVQTKSEKREDRRASETYGESRQGKRQTKTEE